MTGFADRSWTSSDGLALTARDYPAASGPARLPVICLHGLTRNARDFEEVAPRLAAAGRRVLVPDVRGRGRSARDRVSANYNPKTYARDLREMMFALGISEAVFIGTSMGGIITMALSGLSPRLVAAAILNDAGPEIAPAGIARIMTYVGQPVDVADWTGAADYCRRTNQSALPGFGPAEWAAMARRTFREENGVPILDYDPHILSPLQRRPPPGQGLLAWMLFRRLAARCPVLLIRGAQSDVITASIARRMKAKAPTLALADIPGVGHAPLLSEPEAVTAIDRFLDAVR